MIAFDDRPAGATGVPGAPKRAPICSFCLDFAVARIDGEALVDPGSSLCLRHLRTSAADPNSIVII